MVKTKSANNQSPLDEASLQIITNEIDGLRELYIQAENSAQNLFNFYLAFITTIVGGIIVVLQTTPPGNEIRASYIAGGLFLFAATVGIMYCASLSHRYAHILRYAEGQDELRKHLFRTLQPNLPDVYERFLLGRVQKKDNWLSNLVAWCSAVGTYQFFSNLINSSFLVAAIWLLRTAGNTSPNVMREQITIPAISFLLVFIAQNIYARYMRYKLVPYLNLRVNVRDVFFEIQEKRN